MDLFDPLASSDALRRRLRLTWNTLEEFKSDGRARSIGVSNFQVEHLEQLAAETDTVPAVNQIEVHPYFTNEACESTGRITASPPKRGRHSAGRGARRYRHHPDRRQHWQDPAQVVLRWHIQRGDIVFPKSVTPSRMRENFEVFDFELDHGDMDEISTLDQGESGAPDQTPTRSPTCQANTSPYEPVPQQRAISFPSGRALPAGSGCSILVRRGQLSK